MRSQEFCWSQQEVVPELTKQASYLLQAADCDLLRNKQDDVANILLNIISKNMYINCNLDMKYLYACICV